jgi:hypothetical protein
MRSIGIGNPPATTGWPTRSGERCTVPSDDGIRSLSSQRIGAGATSELGSISASVSPVVPRRRQRRDR